MRRKLPLSLRILLGLGLGVLAGLALQNAPEFAAAWIQPFGALFLNLVKMLVDCVLGEVRLISSARRRLHIAAPSWYSNFSL